MAKSIERDIKPFSFEHTLIKVVMGPRRAGKSFFVLHPLSRSAAFGYANFDNEDLVNLENYEELVSEIAQVFEKSKILFFDEIQILPRRALFINRLQCEDYNLVVTGSNHKLLSRELAAHLTGRHIPTTVFTFSYKEYLRAKSADLDKLTTHEAGAP